MMGKPDYRNPLEQQALRRLEQNVAQARDARRQMIFYPVLSVSIPDLERLLYYVIKLEHELDYRDAVRRTSAITELP